MKLKQRPGDFRVMELLRDDALGEKGPHHVYRATKTKLTTLELVDIVAREAGVEKRAVEFAGLKDRQGVTLQYISILGGKRLRLRDPGFQVEWVADSKDPVSSGWVRANGFDITIRGLSSLELERFEQNQESARVHGFPNYFDDQRFGAIRHGQGLLARELIEGKVESALMRCLLSPSPFDPPREAAFKGRLRRAWGDFQECVKLCRGGKHISVFEHLAAHPKDFAGAWRFVSTRIRLIHLYAFQSYLWNLCVSSYLREMLNSENRTLLATDMGALVGFAALTPAAAATLANATFPLLAPDTKITNPAIRAAVDGVLAREGLTLDKLRAPAGIEGFAFKTEERAVLAVPGHLRVLKPERDELNPGLAKLRLRFELPRGSYATLLMKRMFARPWHEAEAAPAPEEPAAQEGQPMEAFVQARTGRRLLAKPRTLRESGALPSTFKRRNEEGKVWDLQTPRNVLRKQREDDRPHDARGGGGPKRYPRKPRFPGSSGGPGRRGPKA